MFDEDQSSASSVPPPLPTPETQPPEPVEPVDSTDESTTDKTDDPAPAVVNQLLPDPVTSTPSSASNQDKDDKSQSASTRVLNAIKESRTGLTASELVEKLDLPDAIINSAIADLNRAKHEIEPGSERRNTARGSEAIWVIKKK